MRRLAVIMLVASFVVLAASTPCLANTYFEVGYSTDGPVLDYAVVDADNFAWGFALGYGYASSDDFWESEPYTALGIGFTYSINGGESSGVYEGLSLGYVHYSGDTEDFISLTGVLGYSWWIRDGGFRPYVEAGLRWSSSSSADPEWEPFCGVGMGLRFWRTKE